MSDLNKIINEQRERIFDLEQKLNDSVNAHNQIFDAFSSIGKRAEAAEKRLAEVERERDEFADCLNRIQNFVTVDSETKDAALSRLKDIIVYDQIKEAKSLNKFAINQQIKGIEDLNDYLLNKFDFKGDFSFGNVGFAIGDFEKQLHQQLNGVSNESHR